MGYGHDDKPSGIESSFERDRRLESRYTFDRQPDESVLGYVSQNQEALAREFMEWRQAHRSDWHNSEAALQGLIRWEGQRFGAALYESAHGLLWFRVRQMLMPAGQKPAPAPRALHRPDGLSEADKLRRFDEAAGRLAREKAI